MKTIIPLPRLIAWELTRRCTLNCRHCRASAQNVAYRNELTFEECQRVMDNMTRFSPPPIMILTGGDPMLRDDIYEIIRYGTNLGLRMVIALCGQHLDRERLERLKQSGILKISFSLDGSQNTTHDAFRGVQGSFDAVLQGMEYAVQVGIPFQVNSTISKLNVNELPAIVDLSIRSGADAFHPFLLVPTGKGKDLLEMELEPEEYEETLRWIYQQSLTQPIMVKPTCAPHYARISRQEQALAATSAHGGDSSSIRASSHARGHGGHSFASMTKGCLGGQGFAFISHIGKVQICGFLDVECGDVRQTQFDFKSIWENSPVFQAIRDVDRYHGKCGACEYWHVCGGCRARAYSLTGDYLADEPFCTYIPNQEKGHA